MFSQKHLDDVAEWYDFSNVSPWETFVSDIEECLRSWGLQDTACTRGGASSNASKVKNKNLRNAELCREVLSYQGTTYTVTLHSHPFMPNRDANASPSLPLTSLWILDNSADFDQTGHRLTQFFGVSEFMILQVAPVGYEDSSSSLAATITGSRVVLSESAARFLLSAAQIALTNCNVCLPVFVPIGDAHSGCFIGVCPPGQSHGGALIHFETSIQQRSAPPALAHVDGLVNLFRSKLSQRQRIQSHRPKPISPAELIVSVRCSWTPRLQVNTMGGRRVAWRLGYRRGMVASKVDTAPWKRRSNTVNILEGGTGVPLWGCLDDPIRGFHITATWAPFRAGSRADNEVFSSLLGDGGIFKRDVTWAARALWVPSIDIDCPLADMVKAVISRFAESAEAHARALEFDLQQAEEDRREEEEEEKLKRENEVERSHLGESDSSMDRRKATYVSPAERLAGRLGTALGKRLRTMVDKHKENRTRERKMREKKRQNKHYGSAASVGARGARRNSLKAVTLDEIFDIGESAKCTFAQDEAIGAAPAGSLLSLLFLRIAELDGLEVTMLWRRFVLALRLHWDKCLLLPMIDPSFKENETVRLLPNLNMCLLHQKLQMLNCCIRRKTEIHSRRDNDDDIVKHEEQGEDVENGWDEDDSIDFELDGEDESIEEKSSDGTEKGGKWTDDEEDDEVFEDAISDESNCTTPSPRPLSSPSSKSTSLEQNLCKETQADVDAILEKEKGNQDMPVREGVLRAIPGIRMYYSDRVICIPRVQAASPITMDMVEEQQKTFIRLGESEEGTRLRRNIQSRQLRCDMEAFKAANPDSVFIDFIRWHSPKDWIEGINEDNEKGGHLSARFSSIDNPWRKAWKRVKAIPFWRQKALWDPSREAERALQWLEMLPLRDALLQLIPVGVHAAHRLLASASSPATILKSVQSKLDSLLQEIAKASHRLGINGSNLNVQNKEPFELLSNLANLVSVAERELARGTSLLNKLPERFELCEYLLETTNNDLTAVETSKDRMVIIRLCQLLAGDDEDDVLNSHNFNDSDFPLPSMKEVIIRCCTRRPFLGAVSGTSEKNTISNGGFGSEVPQKDGCLKNDNEYDIGSPKRRRDTWRHRSLSSNSFSVSELAGTSNVGSTVGAHRMYAMLTGEEFRLATTISDTEF